MHIRIWVLQFDKDGQSFPSPLPWKPIEAVDESTKRLPPPPNCGQTFKISNRRHVNGFQDRQRKASGLAISSVLFEKVSEPMEVLKSMTVAVDAGFELIMSSTIARGREAQFRFHV